MLLCGLLRVEERLARTWVPFYNYEISFGRVTIVRKRTRFAVIGLGLTLAAGACTEAAPAPDKDTQAAAVAQRQKEGFVAPPVGQVVLSAGNMCRWLPAQPLPQSSIQPMFIDGRCAFPMPADGNPKGDLIGVYEQSSQSSKPVGRVESGSFVTGLCYTLGQPIEDGRHNWSEMWVRINTEQDGSGQVGHIPSFATGYALPSNPC